MVSHVTSKHMQYLSSFVYVAFPTKQEDLRRIYRTFKRLMYAPVIN